MKLPARDPVPYPTVPVHDANRVVSIETEVKDGLVRGRVQTLPRPKLKDRYLTWIDFLIESWSQEDRFGLMKLVPGASKLTGRFRRWLGSKRIKRVS
ncbi:hypothetical protein XENORESO_018954 [Xenotaenia resolanae]|uniref:Uncharacterized protein n=1 Tax=Xenotaenia resolanae TaxID=208358 RepID=A0ABV0WGE3_9TELE